MSALEKLIFDRTSADLTNCAMLLSRIIAGTATQAEKESVLTARGAYHASDLNRVSEAEEEMAARFNTAVVRLNDYLEAAKREIIDSLVYARRDYELKEPLLPDALAVPSYGTVNIHPVKKDWTPRDIPTAETTAYYLKNLDILRAVLTVEAPPTPESLDGLTIDLANDIERILFQISETEKEDEARMREAIDRAGREEQRYYRNMTQEWWLCGEIAAGEA